MSSLAKINNEFRRIFDQEDKEKDSESGLPRAKRLSPIEEFYKNWNWFAIVDDLAEGDQTKWEIIFDWNVYRFLNGVAFMNDKKKMIEKEQRRNRLNG